MSDGRRRLAAQHRAVDVVRVGRPQPGPARDRAVVEEPLEIRLHGRPFAVLMRTPGEDRALAAGFLLSEGVIRSAADVGAVEHCRHPDTPHQHNIVDVYLVGEAARSVEAVLDARRNVVASSSCGVCGRLTIESLRARFERLVPEWAMQAAAAAGLPRTLHDRQETFAETGGLHAAGLFTSDGRCEIAAEDVGRHNAVDKVVGAMVLEERLPLDGHGLVVSGRASYEIVQKAWAAGIGLVCAVSAPSSLAIEVAEEAGITLLGFVRDGGFNVYSHAGRIKQNAEC